MLASETQTQPTVDHRAHCAFVLHGLNTNPRRMDSLAHLTESLGYRTSVGILSGHEVNKPSSSDQTSTSSSNSTTAEKWQNEFRSQWSAAVQPCLEKFSERVLIAYSLGALTGLSVFDGGANLPLPTRMILIAPALLLRKKTVFVRALSWLPFGSLPSMNHPDYRARPWTPLSDYRALFSLRDSWEADAWKVTGTTSTLVILSPEDELVDSQGLADQVAQKSMNRWTILWLSNSFSKLIPHYHHLMIDEKSFGQQSWDTFTEQASRFLKGDFVSQ